MDQMVIFDEDQQASVVEWLQMQESSAVINGGKESSRIVVIRYREWIAWLQQRAAQSHRR